MEERLPGIRTVHALWCYWAVIILLHGFGWGLCLHYSHHGHALLAVGITAYMLGLRHAFDVDHIAAVDDTVRYLLQKQRSALGVGFFFSLGHSTVVFLLTMVLACFGSLLKNYGSVLQGAGAVFGTVFSGGYLWIIGILNGLLLLNLWKNRHKILNEQLDSVDAVRCGGVLSRLLAKYSGRWVNHAWHMYPVGFLFGLGFDTASEIALLSLTTGVMLGHSIGAAVALPLIFAAGMSLMDTTDSLMMVQAYRWAGNYPSRRMRYNLLITALSVVVALMVGAWELIPLLLNQWGVCAALARELTGSLFDHAGYAVVGVFMVVWVGCYLWERFHTERVAVW